MRRLLVVFLLLLLGAGAFLSTASCSTTYPRRDPMGERFPTVTGNSLEGEPVTVPGEYLGKPLLLLIGYDQNAQFDLDRWATGLDLVGLQVAVLELPTIPGLGARIASGFIDDGMRSGIPSEDWKSVVTLYSEAAPVAEFTGNEGGRNGRVVLLDAEGKVVFFHDRGFSPGQLRKLRDALQGLGAPAPKPKVDLSGG